MLRHFRKISWKTSGADFQSVKLRAVGFYMYLETRCCFPTNFSKPQSTVTRDHSFRTYVKFSKNLTFLNLCYAQVHFGYALKEWASNILRFQR